jgi:hypothetical protein
MIRFILYSRSYCHLCDDMLQQLQTAMSTSFEIEVIDVDADLALVAQYDELVPVLIGQKDNAPPQQICHYFLDESALKVFLND